MFTGIIVDVGEIAAVQQTPYGARLSIRPTTELRVNISDSVAVNGVCLTLTGKDHGLLHFDCIRETLNRSTLKDARPGMHANLELALGAGDPLGGHFVQGHVDAVGTIDSIVSSPEDRTVVVEAPPDVLALTVEKGSVALDGISLTVSAVDERSFTVKIIPFTWNATNLKHMRTGDAVNVETDILAKYIARMLPGPRRGGLTLEALREAGF